jgi:hypothetical protein
VLGHEIVVMLPSLGQVEQVRQAGLNLDRRYARRERSVEKCVQTLCPAVASRTPAPDMPDPPGTANHATTIRLTGDAARYPPEAVGMSWPGRRTSGDYRCPACDTLDAGIVGVCGRPASQGVG